MPIHRWLMRSNQESIPHYYSGNPIPKGLMNMQRKRLLTIVDEAIYKKSTKKPVGVR